MKRSVLDVHIESFKRGLNIFAAMLSKKDVRIIFQGDKCCTDGNRIYLPNIDLLARPNMSQAQVQEAETYLAALRGFVDHELGHVLFTDFDHLKKTFGNNGGSLRYKVTNALEDPRIERKMAEVWRGAGFNIQNTATYVYDHMDDPKDAQAVGQAVLAAGMIMRKCTDHPLYKKIPVAARRLCEGKQAQGILEKVRESEHVRDTVEGADEFLTLLKQEVEEEKKRQKEKQKQQEKQKKRSPSQPSEGEEGEGEGEDDGEPQKGERKSKSKPKKSKPKKQKEPQEEDDDAPENDEGVDEDGSHDESEEDSGSGAPGDEDEEEDDEAEDEGPVAGGGEDDDEEEEEETSPASGKSFGEELDEELKDQQAAAEGLDLVNDEKVLSDIFKKARPHTFEGYAIYTTADDYIGPPRDTDGPQQKEYLRGRYNILLNEVGRSTLGVLQRSLRNYLKARAHTYKVRDLEQGKIDRRRLYRLPTGISKMIFSQEHEHLDLTNVVVSLYVNASGSMGGKERETQHVTLAFAETLEALNIPFEVVDHTTGAPWASSRNCTQEERNLYARRGTFDAQVYKTFDETWATVRYRLAAYRARSNTYDGEALMMAARRIVDRKEKRKVIFLMDDGLPEPNGGEDVMKHREYLKNYVVPTVMASGIEIIGVGILTDSVEEYYPRAVVVRSMDSLGPTLLTELRRVLVPSTTKAVNAA